MDAIFVYSLAIDLSTFDCFCLGHRVTLNINTNDLPKVIILGRADTVPTNIRY